MLIFHKQFANWCLLFTFVFSIQKHDIIKLLKLEILESSLLLFTSKPSANSVGYT